MRVLINDKEVHSGDSPAEAGRIIGDLLQKQNLYITQISINDVPVNVDLGEALGIKPLEKLEIWASTLKELVDNSVKDALGYLPRLLEGLQNASDLFQRGEENEGTRLFIQATEGIGWVADLASLLENHCQVQAGQAQGSVQTNFFEEMSKELGELLEAWENRDYILIGDLLSYELVPTLESFLQHLEELKAQLS